MKPYTTRIRFSQRTRRRLVVTAYLSLVGFALTLTAGKALWGQAAALSLLCGIFIGSYLLLAVALAYAIGLQDGMPDSYLDERQRALRDRAHRIAFVPVNYYIVGISLTLGLANHWFQQPFFMGLAIAVGFGVISLPSAYIAWLEPDPIEESLSKTATRRPKTTAAPESHEVKP